VLSSISKWCANSSALRILDAGCGTGALLQKLSTVPATISPGIDLAGEALKFCQQRELAHVLQASIHEIPFLANSFDLVMSMDVLCNLSSHDMDAAFREIYRILDRDGLFLFNLPAYNLLKSSHDKAVHLQHRFVKHALQQKLESFHFTVRYITYRNSILFPALALIRIVNKVKLAAPHAVQSDLSPLPSWLNRLLTRILLAENTFFLRGGSFPFGLSLFGVAQKDEL
jgi:SAM-dependent methyltransferase